MRVLKYWAGSKAGAYLVSLSVRLGFQHLFLGFGVCHSSFFAGLGFANVYFKGLVFPNHSFCLGFQHLLLVWSLSIAASLQALSQAKSPFRVWGFSTIHFV